MSHTAQVTQQSFRLKGSMVTLTILELNSFDPDNFCSELNERVSQAPMFFRDMPLLISLEKFSGNDIDFIQLKQICIENGLVPLAVRGGSETLQAKALDADLPKIPLIETGTRDEELQPKSEVASEQSKVTADNTSKTQADVEPKDVKRQSKLIDQPVRSGQRVYAPGADLIIMAAVSAGAEILADGHIHVYGPLRGRALAGVNGDMNARIFCHSLEAELISIAGFYKTSEDFRETFWKQGISAQLQNERLHINAL